MRTLTLDSKNAEKSEDFRTVFRVPIGKYRKIALKYMSLWNSWFNIHEQFNNNVLKYTDHDVEHSITFQNGNYMLSELNEEIKDHYKDKKVPIVFDVHQATSRFVIKLDKGFAVDFREGKLHEILGFESKVYDQPKQRGKYIADISKGIDDIFIHCDLVTSLYNEGTSDILYLFSPLNPPGSMIVINEINPLFEEVNRNDYIDSIRMYITDQDDNIIDLNKVRVIYKLVLD
ncbi:hypothetical protein AVEN_262691-1 [Araneus ventricosus]|uniref:Uncharacterized protein n=1 Tax=Araneus ventricosus TaxID=182803 RepID=A0A4Y2HEV7_ARAVE|nr:hypothetical protein AVEN_262691-1 [Araneus ventricosus]